MDETKPEPAHSKPYKVYETNFLRLMELARASQAPIPDIASRLNQRLEHGKEVAQKLTKTTGTPGKYDFDSAAFQETSALLSDALAEVSPMVEDIVKLLNRSHFLGSWMLVMLVTFAEAYLEDAFSMLIAVGLKGGSLPTDAANEITKRWIKNVMRGGGPHEWLKQLQKFGATGYNHDLADRMQKVWLRRHHIAHSADTEIDNTAMQEFVNATKIVHEFVDTTDHFVVTSCP